MALFLIVIILTTVTNFTHSSRLDLDKALDNLERAVRFSGDEATLRNAIVRIHFILDEAPQEYAVEYGPNDSFVLPKVQQKEIVESLEDRKLLNKKIEKLNQKFNKVAEFKSENHKVEEGVKIIGVGSSLDRQLNLDGDAALYVYPTGEKDAGIIILASDEELAYLALDPFTSQFKREYYKIDSEVDEEDLIDLQNDKAKEIFTEWLK
ncbi:MAG: hypothetical protein HN509_08770 [Halobacteriovoraceae bacterium]|nr:hypothetical protein [Halobacteriovoraceae bacterium]MBT5095330.1 hypothetical protein [Halobacteriovoraceae bacterium]